MTQQHKGEGYYEPKCKIGDIVVVVTSNGYTQLLVTSAIFSKQTSKWAYVGANVYFTEDEIVDVLPTN